MGSLIRAPSAGDRGNRHRQDAHVSPDREVLDVVALDGQALLEGQLAPAEHLHRARDPGLDVDAEAVLGLVALHALDLLRPGADVAHLAAEDVYELRELVEARAAENRA